jgi:hypothetical protein
VRSAGGCAPAAQDCLRACEKLKAKHTGPADKLFWAARDEGDESERQVKYREIRETYDASSWWILARDEDD